MDDITAQLNEHLRAFKGGSICIFGDWFGRPMDNFHKIDCFSFVNGVLTITFNEGETLTVWNPSGLNELPYKVEIIDADRVKWEWYPYGSQKIKENKCYREYVRTINGIKTASNRDSYSPSLSMSDSEPAVIII